MDGEYSLNQRDLWQQNAILLYLFKDEIDFANNFLASPDMIEKRFVEVVGCCIQKLNKIVGS